MSKLLNIPIVKIDANPFRQLEHYPWIESKVDALQRSIADVGFWEGVIVRKVGDRYQLAFGHHRIEAAARHGLKRVRLVVRDLTDEQMLQFMGRENGEDYRSDFTVMMNTWDGAIDYLGKRACPQKDIEVARLLGWVAENATKKTNEMNAVARACSNARKLSEDGHIDTDDLADISVRSAEKIVSATTSKMKRIDKNAKGFGHTAEHVKEAKKTVAKAAKSTATGVRKGTVASKDVAKELESQTYDHARSQKQPTIPDFTGFVKKLSDSLYKVVARDANNNKLEALIAAMPVLIGGEHNRSLDRIEYDLNAMAERATDWVARIQKARNATPVTDIVKPKRLGVVK